MSIKYDKIVGRWGDFSDPIRGLARTPVEYNVEIRTGILHKKRSMGMDQNTLDCWGMKPS